MRKKKFFIEIDNLIRNTTGEAINTEEKEKKKSAVMNQKNKVKHNRSKSPKILSDKQTEKLKDTFHEIKPGNLLTVDQSERLKKDFLNGFDSKKPVRISVEKCDAIDISAVQLLYSLYVTAQKEKRQIKIDIQLTGELKNLLKNAGFYNIFFTGENEDRLIFNHKI